MMICRIQLLLTFTSCVCGTFIMNVTQTSYQAEEGDDITLEWRFPTRNDSSLNFLFIRCEMSTDRVKDIHLYRLHGGNEVPKFQDEQFSGRVQCDKAVLRQGRIRLHVSRLRTNDSGKYVCEVSTTYGADHCECRLNVTARLTPVTDNTASRERIGLYCALAVSAIAVLVLFIRAITAKTS